MSNNTVPKNKLTYPSDLFRQFRKSGTTKENKQLQKTSREMTNSLSLRQCHFPGQSSFLFSKCFSGFSQSLKNQMATFFYSCSQYYPSSPPPYRKFKFFPLPSSLSDSILVGQRRKRRGITSLARVRALLRLIRMSSINAYHLGFSSSHFPSEQCLNSKKKRLVSDLQALRRSARSTQRIKDYFAPENVTV